MDDDDDDDAISVILMAVRGEIELWSRWRDGWVGR